MNITQVFNTELSRPIKYILLDVVLLTAVYFLPALSHFSPVPIYYLDPMRIVFIFAIIFSSRTNSLILALTVPVFSFIIASHPVLIKAVLIGLELSVNVLLFFFLFNKMKNVFFAMALSILAAKLTYYIAKYFLINVDMLQGSLISTPIYIQLIITVMLSIFAALIFRLKLK